MSETKRPLYKSFWGIVLLVFIWPVYLLWYVWKKSDWSTTKRVACTVLVAVIVIVALVSGTSQEPIDHPQPVNKNAVSDLNNSVGKLLKDQPAVAQEQKPKKPYTEFSDGQWEVGTDIKAGKYKTEGSENCYYARLGSFDSSDIIDNNLPNGPATVIIEPTDKAFQSKDCGTWTLTN